ncbi:MAG: PDZ domain-containing protein [Actinobacteria bacterium]|nr:PDZ domain-containing protein [Actinomycetota bacterium]
MGSEGQPGDEFGFQPPPPGERPWRHPSELGSAGGSGRPFSLVTPRPEPARGRGHTLLIALVSGLVGSVVTLAVVVQLGGFQKQPPSPADVQRYEVADSRSSLSPVETAEKVIPSVGRIDVNGPKGQVAGTAVVFRSNAQAGYLITTADVVDGAERISVTIGEGPSLPAQFIGRDLDSDIAVVKVDAPNLPTVVLGRPASKLQIGNPVIAVESSSASSAARGANKVPVGTINGLNERLASDNPNVKTLYGMVKTNLRLTSEATGSPLIDATNGSVIGIVTSRGYRAPADDGQALASSTANPSTTTDQGIIRFATPIDYANRVADQLIKDGRVRRPWLGVNGDGLIVDEAKRLGLKGGFRITNIENNSPATEARLHVDDVLLSIDNVDVSSLDDLTIALREHQPGDTVTIFYFRAGERQPTYATLTERNPGS